VREQCGGVRCRAVPQTITVHSELSQVIRSSSPQNSIGEINMQRVGLQDRPHS
jgi:hypothetical protein